MQTITAIVAKLIIVPLVAFGHARRSDSFVYYHRRTALSRLLQRCFVNRIHWSRVRTVSFSVSNEGLCLSCQLAAPHGTQQCSSIPILVGSWYVFATLVVIQFRKCRTQWDALHPLNLKDGIRLVQLWEAGYVDVCTLLVRTAHTKMCWILYCY